MERQVALALVALCALLGCACSQCVFEEHADRSLEPLLLASPLELVLESDPDSCRARCCARADCDAAVLGMPADGAPQCFLVGCGGACTLREEGSTQFKVFLRTSDTHAPENAPQLVPLMMDVSTRTDDNNRNSTVSKEVCVLSSEVGLCKAAFPRFFYNASAQTCSSFIYGGCGGNGNNFETKEDCERLCSGVTRSDEDEKLPQSKSARMAPPLQPEPSEDYSESEDDTELIPDEPREMTDEDYAEHCGSKPDVGPCRAAFPRWFYNGTSGRCQSFIYGGCKGNKNNYEREDECSSVCSGIKVLPSKKKSPEQESEEFRELCGVRPDSGPCRAAFSMFYYHPESDSCRSFIYGGCKGNNNRYGSEEECMTRCSGGASSEGHGEVRNRWTAAFFLFLTLAAVSFLMLTTLIIITLRRHRLPRRFSSISDKEELLPDSDERSSVDSLPLPESPTTA